MNKLLLTVILLTLSLSLTAKANEVCELEKEYASLVMQLRQGGVDISEVLEIADDNPRLERIVFGAYNHPQMMSRSNRERVIREYTLAVYLECMSE